MSSRSQTAAWVVRSSRALLGVHRSCIMSSGRKEVQCGASLTESAVNSLRTSHHRATCIHTLSYYIQPRWSWNIYRVDSAASRWCIKFCDMFSRFDTAHKCNRWTDRIAVEVNHELFHCLKLRATALCTWWCIIVSVRIWFVTIGCRAFGIFSPEVFEQALKVFKILNASGTACGFVCAGSSIVCLIAYCPGILHVRVYLWIIILYLCCPHM